MATPICAATSRSRSAACGRRRDDLGADAAALHGLDDGVGAHLARRAPRDLLGELAREVDELLDEQRAAARVFGERREPVVGLGRGGRRRARPCRRSRRAAS